MNHNEERLNDILSNVSDWVWELDLNGNFVFVSGNTLDILGYSHAELLQMNAFDLMSSAEAERVGQVYEQVINEKKPFRDMVNINLTKSGEERMMMSSGVPVFDSDDQLIGYRGADRDVTVLIELQHQLTTLNSSLEAQVKDRTRDLKQAVETAEQANLSKSRFIASVSHELRTPMHAILSFSQLGLKSVDDQKVRRYLENILTSGNRLLKVIDDLLDLSKLEAGKMEIYPEVLNLVPVIEESVEELHGLIKDKGLLIKQNLPDKLICQVDKKLVHQLIVNLLSNALKFSAKGTEISIFARIDEKSSTNSMVQLSIEDQGEGIARENLESIFENFVQVTEGATGIRGTGLGLPICRQIVTLHKGKIWAESPPPGKSAGTVFHVIWPL